MAEYVTGLVIRDIAVTHLRFAELFRTAAAVEAVYARLGQRSPVTNLRRALLREYAVFNRELDIAARRSAVEATKLIKGRIEATKKRPFNAIDKVHLRDTIRCRPLKVGALATGAVGVADVSVLERAVNPFDKSRVPYWIVQEEGTTANVGREIKGYFFGPAFTNPARPAAGYTGTKSAQPIFLTGTDPHGGTTGPQGGTGGKGTIRHPIKARHFIRDGTAAAGVEHARNVRTVERATIRSIEAILLGSRRP